MLWGAWQGCKHLQFFWFIRSITLTPVFLASPWARAVAPSWFTQFFSRLMFFKTAFLANCATTQAPIRPLGQGAFEQKGASSSI